MTAEVPASERPADIRAVPARHPGRWVASVVVLVLLAMLAHLLVTNKNLGWSVVRHYLFNPIVRRGVVTTIELTILAMVIGVFLGIVLAVMRLSKNPVTSWVSWVYIWFFRGTPVLVQIIFWFNINLLIKSFALGVPFGPHFVSWKVNDVITPFVAAVLALGLNEAAYMAEIVRAGLLSVDEGQTEAAHALGMTRLGTLIRIVLPQAMRVIIPPTGNETISMLKTSSLAYTISVLELLRATQSIAARNLETIPLLLVASIWYIVMTSVLTGGQFYVERYFARGASRTMPKTPLQKIRANLIGLGRHGSGWS
ncbi:MAG: polar amino acid transport system permease protein [Actinomycetota bacterium]|nr:polar amino acid transport system permease protein [Actinomycetota bacterium]